MTSKEFVDSIRQVADWYEQHPDVPVPYVDNLDVYSIADREQLIQIARTLGAAEKQFIGDYFALARKFGTITLRFVAERQVACERRVVGTEEVPEKITPAHTREIVEWDCHPLLSPSEAQP